MREEEVRVCKTREERGQDGGREEEGAMAVAAVDNCLVWLRRYREEGEEEERKCAPSLTSEQDDPNKISIELGQIIINVEILES